MQELSWKKMACFLIALCCGTASFATEPTTFDQFISLHVPLRADGKIDIPNHIRHVKLDIGLSYNAPHSQYWLNREENLIVFGFEPNPEAVNEIKKGAVKRSPAHGTPLDTCYIGNRFFLIPCALGISTSTTAPFYVTTDDCGCSSLYEPVNMRLARIIDVPLFSLSDFFDRFPFDTHPVIDYIKIDAQGADLDIVKSAGDYLSDRVVYITIEAENSHYKNTINSENDIDSYMQKIGFTRHKSSHTQDPTYMNMRFWEYVWKNNIQIYQKG